MAFYQSLKYDRKTYPLGRDAPGQAGWITDRLLRIRAMMNGQITSKRDPDSLIIGSWNIRHFDGGRPRMPESFHYIAEIIDHFDICAIQEVKNIDAIKRLIKLLGPNWDFFINDSSGGGRGNHERMAFLYDTNKVQFRNLIGELVVDQTALAGGEQIGRTPFFASFQAGWFRFTLCSAHIVFTEVAGRPLREDEIKVIADILRKRAKNTDEVHIFLGDFNTDDRVNGAIPYLQSKQFIVPDFGETNVIRTKHYDHITFTGPQDESDLLHHGAINFTDAVFREDEVEDYRAIAEEMRGEAYSNWPRSYGDWRTHEMSDHLPIWMEIRTDYSNRYLRSIGDLE
jgi:hypothetical protein